MGNKRNYFRHSIEAHNDPKIIDLVDRGGAKALGVYFVLLEIFGSRYSDDEERSVEQEISLRRIATATGLRSDSCWTCIRLATDSQLIEAVRSKSHQLTIKVRIANFPKFFGSYEKKGEQFRQSKGKESKGKGKKKEVVSSVEDVALFKEIIDGMNHILGSNYTVGNKRTISMLKARVSEGYKDPKEYSLVITHRLREWGSDEKMKTFLRPSTLFGSKFEEYLQSAIKQEAIYEKQRKVFADDD